jgi:hypothetical protein
MSPSLTLPDAPRSPLGSSISSARSRGNSGRVYITPLGVSSWETSCASYLRLWPGVARPWGEVSVLASHLSQASPSVSRQGLELLAPSGRWRANRHTGWR